MAKGVGRGRICLASFNRPTQKTPVIAYFASNFVFMATGGHPYVNLNDAV